MSSLIGKRIAAVSEITTVSIITRIPEDTDEIIGSLEKARLADIEMITRAAITLFFFAGGIIIARNIP